MLAKKDLENIGELVNREIGNLRKEFRDELEILLAQIVKAFTEASREFATKEELKEFRTEVEGRFDKVETDVIDIKRDVQDIKTDMPTKDDFKNLKKLEEIHRKELASYA